MLHDAIIHVLMFLGGEGYFIKNFSFCVKHAINVEYMNVESIKMENVFVCMCACCISESEISLDRCLLSQCQYCVCS